MTATVLLVVASGLVGGGTTHVLALARGLPRVGFRPVVVSDPVGPLLDMARACGCDVRAEPLARASHALLGAAGLRRAIADVRPDVVHAHGTRAGLLVALARRGAEPVFVFTEHGLATDVPRRPLARSLARWGERVVLRTADKIVAVSEHGRTRIAEREPSASARVRVVPNAVGEMRARRDRATVLAELGLPQDARVVGSVLRFVAQKAPLDLVAAAAAVARGRPSVALLAVGDGPLLGAARAAARDVGLRTAFPGERADVADLLGAMDVFVLASHWEGMPIAALEAMAAGVPVVATDVGGVSTVVRHGETGLLCPPRDPAAIAESVRVLLDNPPTGARLAAAARSLVRERYREGLAPRVAAVYREALGP